MTSFSFVLQKLGQQGYTLTSLKPAIGFYDRIGMKRISTEEAPEYLTRALPFPGEEFYTKGIARKTNFYTSEEMHRTIVMIQRMLRYR